MALIRINIHLFLLAHGESAEFILELFHRHWVCCTAAWVVAVNAFAKKIVIIHVMEQVTVFQLNIRL